MKKIISISAMVLLIAVIAAPALAHGPGWGSGKGHHMMDNYGMSPGNDRQYGPDPGSLTDEQRGKLEQLDREFYSELVNLRNQLWAKLGELDLLITKTDPDLEKAKAIQREISDIRTKIDEKHLKYALEVRKILPDDLYGRGNGLGYGHHMGGYDHRMGHGNPMGGYGHMMGYGSHMGGYGPANCR